MTSGRGLESGSDDLIGPFRLDSPYPLLGRYAGALSSLGARGRSPARDAKVERTSVIEIPGTDEATAARSRRYSFVLKAAS